MFAGYCYNNEPLSIKDSVSFYEVQMQKEIKRSSKQKKNIIENGVKTIDKDMSMDRQWKCDRCDRQYKWKYSLNHHVRHECGIPPKYKCDNCMQYKTNIYGNFKRHQFSCENKSDSWQMNRKIN